MADKAKKAEVAEDPPIGSIEKPKGSGLSRFKSRFGGSVAHVETLLTELPILKIGGTKDFVWLHPNEEIGWTDELCFISVPVEGQRDSQLHLIPDELAMEHLEPDDILRFRLALASKPYDKFALIQVPTQNLDNPWNSTAVQACEKGKHGWVKASSRKKEGVEGYKINYPKHPDFAPEPNWPSRTIDELVEASFPGRMIDAYEHPALLRKIGAKLSLK
jgi:hypothetical protein